MMGKKCLFEVRIWGYEDLRSVGVCGGDCDACENPVCGEREPSPALEEWVNATSQLLQDCEVFSGDWGWVTDVSDGVRELMYVVHCEGAAREIAALAKRLRLEFVGVSPCQPRALEFERDVEWRGNVGLAITMRVGPSGSDVAALHAAVAGQIKKCRR